MKPHEATEVVMTLISAFPSTKADARTAAVYEHMLADLDGALVRKAVARIITTQRFLPTVAEIRQVAMELESGAKRCGADAWADVLWAIRRVGSYRPQPKFDDPIVEHIVTRWGWRDLCLGENAVADRARFVQWYDELSAQCRSDLVSGVPTGPQLVGSEAHAQLGGRRV